MSISDLLSAVQLLIGNLQSATRRQKDHNAAVLDEVCGVCDGIVKVENVSGDEALLLHKELKLLYANVSTSLGGSLTEGQLALVMRAIASARMYYWLRIAALDPAGFIKVMNERCESNRRALSAPELTAIDVHDTDFGISAELVYVFLEDGFFPDTVLELKNILIQDIADLKAFVRFQK